MPSGVRRRAGDSVIRGGELAAAATADFPEDVRQVDFDGGLADRQTIGHFLVRETGRRVAQHLALPLTQALPAGNAQPLVGVPTALRPRRSDDIARRPDLSPL